MVPTKDRDVLRRLASDIAGIAQLPEQEEKIEGWTRINGLKPHRPMVWITEIPWGEFEHKIPELRTVCEDERCRGVEQHFRRTLFTARHLPCHAVVHDVFWVPKVIHGSDFGVIVEEEKLAQNGGTYIQSHHYKPAIKDFPDIDKIKMPDVRYDEEETQQNLSFFRQLFGDILAVKPSGPRQHFFPAWDRLVVWTGVTEALMDLVARPDFIHAIMRRMTDSFLARMDQYEKQGLLDYPHPLARVGSGAAGYTDELPQPDVDPAHIRTIDQWGGATPQIFSDVSPDMHEEFALKYENEVMARCGLNYYGCCEPLHNKMHILARVPRLRKISISPWCDVAKAVENATRNYVFSHKPNPAILAEDTFNAERAERDIRERIAKSREMPCEFILKDISTVRGDVTRVIAWCEIASRVARETAPGA
ncbi:MAG: hypothetical protein K9N51_03365 [Candidatus Pacebacteria bacterium]|nr:hypothetical protein [Candidatus Paceibacterota bacterium]